MKIYNKLDLLDFSRVATTGGHQIKFLSGNSFVKKDTMGYEALAEVLVSELESRIVNENFKFVDYSFCRILDNGRYFNACFSESFLSEDDNFIPIYTLIKENISVSDFNKLTSMSGINFVNQLIEYITQITNINISEITDWLSCMVKLDYLILNEDRHLGNFGVILNNRRFKLAPLFDHGLSLLSDTSKYLMNLGTELIKRVKARPFNSSFKKQIRYFENSEKLKIKDAEFFFNNIDVDKFEIP